MKLIPLFSLLSISLFSFAQPPKYSTGLKFDEKTFRKNLSKTPPKKGTLDPLPPSSSLKKYCPPVGNQGDDQTCAAWAVCYYGMSILENKKNNYNPTEEDPFSPLFAYNLSKKNKEVDCNNPRSVEEIMDVVEQFGCPRFQDYGSICEAAVPLFIKNKAAFYKNQYTYEGIEKINDVKRSISEGIPVIAAVEFSNCLESGDWNIPYIPSKEFHALTISGYSDNKQAFEVVNSWGENWGNQGYLWITYKQMKKIAKGYYKILNKQPNRVSIKLTIEIFNKKNKHNIYQIPLKYDSDEGYYKTEITLDTTTLYSLKLHDSNGQYLYLLSVDENYQIIPIYPNDKNYQFPPQVPNNNRKIWIPSPKKQLQVTRNKKDWLCILYTREPLSIGQLIKEINKKNGTSIEKIYTYFNNNFKKYEVKNGAISINTEFNSKRNVLPIFIKLN